MRERDEDAFDERVRAAYVAADEHDAAGANRTLDRLRSEPRPRPLGLAWDAWTGEWRLRPAFAAVAALVLLGAGAALGRLAARTSHAGATRAPVAVAAAAEPGVPVYFALRAPGASQVSLAGDFNGWDPLATPMARAGEGVWVARVALAPGVHAYSFVLEGREWKPDPAAPLAAEAAFGTRRSMVLVEDGRAL